MQRPVSVKKGVFQKFCCTACFARPDIEFFGSIFGHNKAMDHLNNLTEARLGTNCTASTLTPPCDQYFWLLVGEIGMAFRGKYSAFKSR